MEAKTALLTEVGMNINCYINAKVYFKMACVRVRVRVRVRAYPHFPTTPIVLLILIRTHRAPYVMATRPQKEDLALPAPPTTNCVQYEGNGSKRWVGKSILRNFVDVV